MLKYVGVLLTLDQVAQIASNITKKDLTDLKSDSNMFSSLSTLTWQMERHFKQIILWSTSVPRFSEVEDHQRILLVCHSYDNPSETLDDYKEIPAMKRDAKILKWLKRNGMKWNDMVGQWTTLPDPKADERWENED